MIKANYTISLPSKDDQWEFHKVKNKNYWPYEECYNKSFKQTTWVDKNLERNARNYKYQTKIIFPTPLNKKDRIATNEKEMINNDNLIWFWEPNTEKE